MLGLKNEKEIIEEAIVEVRKKNKKKKLIIISVCSVLLLAVIFALWVSGYSYSKSKYEEKIEELRQEIKDMKEKPLAVEPITPEIVMKTLSDKTIDISELVTAEYAFTNAAKFTSTKHIAVLPESWTQKSFVQRWDGIIKAGINLKGVNVSISGKTITVEIPDADIISYEIDKDSVEILDEKNNVFNPITVKDKVNFDKETAYDMKAKAVKNGLLDRAQENAENTIENIIRVGIGKLKNIQNIYDYEIVFKNIN